jgi:hypothetical protein
VVIRYPPAKLRAEGDRPVALLGVRIAPSYRLVDLPLGPPTTSARSQRGTWALFTPGEVVVVVHPDGAVIGRPADVAVEVGRLAAHERQGELDRQAARTIRHLLVGDGGDRARPAHRSGDRTSPRLPASRPSGSRHVVPTPGVRPSRPVRRGSHRRRRTHNASQGGRTR